MQGQGKATGRYRNPRRVFCIYFDASSLITFDEGKTTLTIQDHIENLLGEPKTEAQEGVELDLLRPNLQVKVADVWVDCTELRATLNVKMTVYLKYLTPDEYSHIRDHVRETTIPLHVVISGHFPILDETFIELPNGQVPVLPGLFLRAEEWTNLERAQGKAGL